MKTAVIVLGYNVNERNWLSTVWGTPQKPGRLPKGVALMIEMETKIFLITGCGEKEGREGVEWMRDLLYQRLEELSTFTIYPALALWPVAQIKEKLDRAIRLEWRSEGATLQTTQETMINTGELLIKEGVERIIIVSSPDHIPRCMQNVLSVWGERWPTLTNNLLGTSCSSLYTENDGQTPQERASVADVVVIEPRSPVGPLAQRMFGISNNSEALAEIEAILKKYGK